MKYFNCNNFNFAFRQKIFKINIISNKAINIKIFYLRT